jgi:hypothetical protein
VNAYRKEPNVAADSADWCGSDREMKDANGDRASVFRNGPRTLAIDVGGTGLKASVLDGAGRMLVKRVRVATPYPCQPEILFDLPPI